MLGKIREATKGKPCSCPTGKICSACKTKKPVRVKPQIYVEGFKALPVPVKIKAYKDKTPCTVLYPPRKNITIKKETPKTPSFQKIRTCSHSLKPATSGSANQGTSICRWYKRRKALGELREITRLERKKLENLQREQARREREAEFVEQLVRREKVIRDAELKLAATPSVLYYECPKPVCRPKTTLSKPKKKKAKKNNIKGTEANLCCKTKVVCENAKKYQKRPIGERFSNFCYRICCQFYCCVTFLMVIGLVIIYFS